MIAPLLLLPLLLFIASATRCRSFTHDPVCINKQGTASIHELSFNRVDMTTDVHRHLSVKLYASSTDSTTMYTMLLFHAPHQIFNRSLGFGPPLYHNALSIGGAVFPQFYKITKDSRLFQNNEIPLLAKAYQFMMPYTVINSQSYWLAILRNTAATSNSGADLDQMDVYDSGLVGGITAPTYEATLSVAPGSSIWTNYNIMRITQYHVSMRYEPDGEVSNDVSGYSALTLMQCHGDGVHDCRINVSGITINDIAYNARRYRVAINLHSAANYLPVDLYYHITSLPQSSQSIRFYIAGGASLILNSNFEYGLNAHDDDIIIGVDLLHYFPKVEYSIESGQLAVWYVAGSYVTAAQHDDVSITFSFVLLLLLIGYWEYTTSENVRLYTFMIYYTRLTGRWFFFSFRQVFTEIGTLALSFILIILTFVFMDYNSSNRCQRAILLWILALYHFILLSIVLVITPETTRRAFIYYLRFDTKIHVAAADPPLRLRRLATRSADDSVPVDAEFDQVKEAYIERDEAKLSKELTINVIARNTGLLMLLMIDMMMILNFGSDTSYLYLLLLFFVSLIFIVFIVYQLGLITLFFFTYPRGATPTSFTVFYAGELACGAIFIAWSIPVIFLDYFRAINSIYSETFVVAFTLVLLTMLFLISCKGFYAKIDYIVRKRYIPLD